MTTSSTPSGGRRRAGPVGPTRLSVRPAGLAAERFREWVRLMFGLLPQGLHPVDQFVDPRSEPLVARRSRPTWRCAGHARLVLPCGGFSSAIGRPSPTRQRPAGRLLALGRHHRGRGAALQPDPGVRNLLTRYVPVCVLDCPAHRRSLTPCERTGGGCDSSLQATGTNRPPRARPSRSLHDRPDLFGRRWRE